MVPVSELILENGEIHHCGERVGPQDSSAADVLCAERLDAEG